MMMKTYDEILEVVETERKESENNIPSELVEKIIQCMSNNLDDQPNGLKEIRKIVDKYLDERELDK